MHPTSPQQSPLVDPGTNWVLNVLGPLDSFPRVRNTLELIQATRDGLPYYCVEVLQERGATGPDIDWVLGSRRTKGRRRSSANPRLNRRESERVVRLARIIGYAEHVFANQEKAQHWLQRKNPLLGNRRPLDLVQDEQGAQLVETVLDRVAYGDYS